MKFWSIALPVCWAVIVCVLHLVKVDIDPNKQMLIPHADKIVHFGMFATLAFLIFRSMLFHGYSAGFKFMMIAVLVCLLYGAILELLQKMSNGHRDGDIYDWLADFVGSLTGVLIATTSFLPLFFRHQFRKTT
jgi:VanZ family protein